MRILLVHPGPEFSVADVYSGYAEAFAALGHEVRGFELNDRLAFYTNVEIDGRHYDTEQAIQMVNKHLEAKCYEFMPDVVIVISGFFINQFTWDLWKHRPHQIVALYTESPYEDDKQLAVAEAAMPDLVVVNDPINLDKYRQRGLRTFYVPHSYRPERHRPDNEAPTLWDFAFVGTGYPSRVEFFEQVNWDGLSVALGGHWAHLDIESRLRSFLVHHVEECLDNEQASRIYQRSRVSANLYRAGRGYGTIEANKPHLAEGWAMGPREVELAATGTFFARESRGESDLLFPMLPIINEPKELESIIRWAINNDDQRTEAANKARAAIADRTFNNHARRILALLP
jgi:hypothetical protein